MLFDWSEHGEPSAEGVVLAVDVTRHARRAGLEGPTFVSRGFWSELVVARSGPEEEARLLSTLRSASRAASEPDARVNEDGTVVLFGLRPGDSGPRVEVVSVVDQQRTTLMLWREFAHRPAGPNLRVRVVAEDEPKARA